jgi:hypothetical protein
MDESCKLNTDEEILHCKHSEKLKLEKELLFVAENNLTACYQCFEYLRNWHSYRDLDTNADRKYLR